MDNETLSTLTDIGAGMRKMAEELGKVNNNLRLLEAQQKGVLAKFGQSVQDYLMEMTKTQIIIQNKLNEIKIQEDTKITDFLEKLGKIYSQI